MLEQTNNLAELARFWGDPFGLTSLSGCIALVSDGFMAVYRDEGLGLHELLYLKARDDLGGAPARDLLNDSFAWMFTNTDAVVIRGRFALDNLACKGIALATPLAKLEKGPVHYRYTITLASWAKRMGVPDAASALSVAGRPDKASRLVAAWHAQGSPA